MAAEETPQNRPSLFNFFPDGVRVNYYGRRYVEARLSNIPKNLSKWSSLAVTAAATAYQFLGNTVSANPDNYNLCPGALSTYYFEAPNGTPYQINLVNIRSPVEAANLRSFAHHLHDLLQNLPQYCSANPIISAPINYPPGEGRHYYLQAPLIMGYRDSVTDRVCNAAEFISPANMPADPSFEACLYHSISNLRAQWTKDFFTFMAKQSIQDPSYSFWPIFIAVASGAIAGMGLVSGGRYFYTFFKHRREKAILAPQPSFINDDRLKEIGFNPDNIPKNFICPITCHIMDDPVTVELTTQEGQTIKKSYEKIAIEKWIKLGHTIDPLTNLSFKNKTLTQDTALKKKIEAFLTKKETGYPENNAPNIQKLKYH